MWVTVDPYHNPNSVSRISLSLTKTYSDIVFAILPHSHIVHEEVKSFGFLRPLVIIIPSCVSHFYYPHN